MSPHQKVFIFNFVSIYMYWDFSVSKCYVIGSYTNISFVDRSIIICFSARLILDSPEQDSYSG